MSELSIFIDESGDFGTQSSFYLLTFVFHDQSVDISSQLARLSDTLMAMRQRSERALHTGPMVRREDEYSNLPLAMRRKLFDHLLTFTRTAGVTYASFSVEKRQWPDRLKLKARLSREVSLFLRDNLAFFTSFDRIIVYYDNGQSEITDLINTLFSAYFFEVDFRKVKPSDYRLFQSADLLCTLEMLRAKLAAGGQLSNSEKIFFESTRLFARLPGFRGMDMRTPIRTYRSKLMSASPDIPDSAA